MGQLVHAGAVEVGHSVLKGVQRACACGLEQGPTGHRQRNGRVRAGHRGAHSWGKTNTT